MAVAAVVQAEVVAGQEGAVAVQEEEEEEAAEAEQQELQS